MEKYLSMREASKKISNLCKAIGDFEVGCLGAEPKFVSELLKTGHNYMWISKSTGLLYFNTPKYAGNYINIQITCKEDKYKLEIL